MPLTDISTVSADALNIVTLLDNVLDAVVNTYTSYNVPLPARQYWTLGMSSIDCEQLTITLIQGYLGPPGSQQSQPQRCNMPRSVTMLITVARQIPVVSQSGRAPLATTIEDGSRIGAIDAWVLLESINLLDQWDVSSGFGVGVIGSVEIPPPDGGFQLVTLQLTMAVP